MTVATMDSEQFAKRVMEWCVLSKTSDQILASTMYCEGQRMDMIFVMELPFTYRQFSIFLLRATHRDSGRVYGSTLRAAEREWRAMMETFGMEAPQMRELLVRMVERLKHAQQRIGGDDTEDGEGEIQIPLHRLVQQIEEQLEA